MDIRRAQFMGSWYPASDKECEAKILDFISDMPEVEPGIKRLGGIVPHAGWVYSGMIAAQVIAALKGDTPPDVIAVFGMHLAPRHPNFIMAKGAWETPFGPLEIAEDVAGQLAKGFTFEIESADRHVQDNTIELQLPFIKYFFPKARIVPIGVPPTDRSLAIGEAFVDVAGRLGYSAKVIGSTDLTHYGSNYGFSPVGSGPKAIQWVKRENDRKVLERIMAMDPRGLIDQALENSNACCGGAAATAIAAAKRLGAERSQILAYSTSYDITPAESFVGYVGAVF
ncbi:MAG: AmmeMemoRadiSam system protein B [Desulfatibacillum sp.]|nr:AmmeMemoRadiSam system protein B [Desulfatibacillum sp.]